MKYVRLWQALVLVAVFTVWYVLTEPGLVPPFLFDNDSQAAFFFGQPLAIFGRIWRWFVVDADIYRHLWVTLIETVLAFGLGALFGLAFGLWLALSPMAAAILDPYITALNSMPRIILAPIFAVWFGLGIASKVALGVTLVFFIVFFNVYQGVKEVSPVVLANARMLGANQRQLLRHVYLPSATSWVFSSLHTSVGLAFVGAVVGEYLGSAARGGLPHPAGRGHVRHQHRDGGHPGAHRLCPRARHARRAHRAAPDEVAAEGGRDREAVAVGRQAASAAARERGMRASSRRPDASTAMPIHAALNPPSSWLCT